MNYCSNCGNGLSYDEYCGNCGRKTKPHPTCKTCGQQFHTQYCPRCGKSEDQKKAQARSAIWTLSICFSVGGLITFFLFYFDIIPIKH